MTKHMRSFHPTRDRYYYDETLRGFAQVDTYQDAPYFGTWINPVERKIVTFCEGDVTETTCETDDELKAEVIRMKEYYQDGFKGIDPGWPNTESCKAITARLEAIGLAEFIH